MKRVNYITAVALLMLTASGCATTYTASSYGAGDLYTSNHKTLVAQRQKQKAEQQKAEAEARQAQWEAMLAQANADAAEQRYYSSADVEPNYNNVLADTYESAYARRLYGFNSPTYRMPSSYYSLSSNRALHYASAYDPAFYNVMVSGDQVWVEPKYITAMFGSWGRPSIYVAVELGVELPRRSVLQLVVGLSALLVVRLELEHLLQSHLERLVVGRTLSPLGLGTSALGSRTLGAAPADAPTRRKLELEQQPSQQQP